jgi:hypothetical protein
MAEVNPKTFWGWVTTLTVAAPAGIVATALAVASGTIEAANGGSFKDGAEKVFDSLDGILQAAADFGDKHSDTITSAAIKGAVGIAAGAAGDSIRRHNDPGSS